MEIVLNNVYLKLNQENRTLDEVISKMLKVEKTQIKSFKVLKKAVDARKKNDITFVYTVLVRLNNSSKALKPNKNINKNIPKETIKITSFKPKKRPVIIGFGPAGMFAALYLARAGTKPVIIERGKMVDQRIEDIKNFILHKKLNPNSNYCFGEGGAGTFSDGKLNTSLNDERIRFIINEFIKHGAPEDIYYNAKPHIGTDYLRKVVKSIREEIIELGGTFRFETKFIDFIEQDGAIEKIIIEESSGEKKTITCSDVILAIGHSARDTYTSLYRHKLVMQAKSFSVGVRIEHRQQDLDKIQYGKNYLNEKLDHADYKLSVNTKDGRGVYTFCMCPGGSVVPCSTEEGQIVTNGMSEFKRDLENCNSALLVSITPQDYYVNSPLDGMYFQESLERLAFNKDKPYAAPVQRVGDFLKGIESSFIMGITPSYQMGYYFTNFNKIFPRFVIEALRSAIPLLGKKLPIFNNENAILTGVETRTSSPLQISRDKDYNSSVKGLYPCGEGAGYAGGITSSCLDGLNVAQAIQRKYSQEK